MTDLYDEIFHDQVSENNKVKNSDRGSHVLLPKNLPGDEEESGHPVTHRSGGYHIHLGVHLNQRYGID